MDRARVKEQLEQVRYHIAQGEKHIARQRRLVAELELDGHEATHARETLNRFEDLQRLHVQERDRLERELASDAE